MTDKKKTPVAEKKPVMSVKTNGKKTPVVEKEQEKTPAVVVEKELTISDILKGISLDEVTILDGESTTFETTINKIILDTTPFKQVPCLQSGYVAHMKAATLTEIDSIGDMDADIYQVQVNLYKTIYNLLVNTSVGKIGFDDFLRFTSYYDLSTLMYGIYAKTFKNPNSLDVTCNNLIIGEDKNKKPCGHTSKITVENDELIQISDESIYEEIKNLISKTSNPEDLVKYSLVAKMSRKAFYNNAIIIDSHVPSLRDHLSMLKLGLKYDELMTGSSAVASLVLHTHRLLLINEKETLKQKKPVYNKYEDKEKLYKVISNFEPEQSKPILDAIVKRDTELIIHYKTPTFECEECKQEIPGIPIDIEDWLFQHVLEIKG